MSSSEFNKAQANVAKLTVDPGNETKLKLYGLFKQATVGDCNTNKPGIMDIVGKSKWNAWNKLKKMSKTEAEKKYIDLVNELLQQEKQSDIVSDTTKTKYKYLNVTIEFGNIYKIYFNRPEKYNALCGPMYLEVIEALKEADSDENINICCITGNGDYFSSGNDLKNFSEDNTIEHGCQVCENYVNAFINFSKPLVAFVNGPAIGISFTILGLFDMVIASSKATFYSPFTQISLSPEGCSSFTFPKIMGKIKASDILLFNKKLTADEAFNYGILTDVIDHSNFQKETAQKLKILSEIPRKSLIESKKFMAKFDKEMLMDVNKQEMQLLKQRLETGDFLESVALFMSKKSKL